MIKNQETNLMINKNHPIPGKYLKEQTKQNQLYTTADIT